MSEKRGPQIRVSALTHARAEKVKDAIGANFSKQLTLAHDEWVAKHFPEIYKSVQVVEEQPETPPAKKKRK